MLYGYLTRFLPINDLSSCNLVLSIPTFFHDQKPIIEQLLHQTGIHKATVLYDTTACFSPSFTFLIIISTSYMIAAISYINQLNTTVKPTEGIMIVDFGALGLQVSVYRLQYPSALECVAHVYTQEISGDWVDAQFVKHFEPEVLARWKALMEEEGRTELVEGGQRAEDSAAYRYVRSENVVGAVHQMLPQLRGEGEVSESVLLVPFDAEVSLSLTASEAEALLVKEMRGWVQNTVTAASEEARQRDPHLHIDHVRVAGAASLLPLFRRVLEEVVGGESMLHTLPLLL